MLLHILYSHLQQEFSNLVSMSPESLTSWHPKCFWLSLPLLLRNWYWCCIFFLFYLSSSYNLRGFFKKKNRVGGTTFARLQDLASLFSHARAESFINNELVIQILPWISSNSTITPQTPFVISTPVESSTFGAHTISDLILISIFGSLITFSFSTISQNIDSVKCWANREIQYF